MRAIKVRGTHTENRTFALAGYDHIHDDNSDRQRNDLQAIMSVLALWTPMPVFCNFWTADDKYIQTADGYTFNVRED